MSDNAFYTVFLCLSIFSLVAAVVIGALLRAAARKADKTKKHAALTPFHVFLIGFFVASVFAFYPVMYSASDASESAFVHVVKSLLTAILTTLQAFFLNGDFSTAESTVNGVVTGGLATGYNVFIAVMYVIAPVLTFGFILSFFRESISMLKYALHPFRDVYILSELNESSIELAKDIFKNAPGKKQVVFTDVFEKDDESVFELVTEARRLGAICLKKDITELGLKRADVKRKLFFIGKNEDENLRQALAIINRCKDDKRYDKYSTQLYVFACSKESEALLDSADRGNMRVRRINERRNLVIDTLYEHSVFKGAVKDKKEVLHINAAIVGLGTYGTELLKVLCWLCQIPNYELTVHVFDSGNGKDKITFAAPELISHNNEKLRGEPHYNIIFHDNVDVKSTAFKKLLMQTGNLTAAFVTLGTDEQNIETSMMLRMIFARGNKDDTAKQFPPIYTVVYSSLKNEIVRLNGGLKGVPLRKDGNDVYNNDYGIEFLGDTASRFSLKVIEQTELELEARDCHMRWSSLSDPDKRKEDEDKFEQYEYFRKSSTAESLHRKYLQTLAPQLYDENGIATIEGGLYEHNRWNAYMRSEGYTLPETPGRKNHIAKLHCDLRPYAKLSEKDKEKDIAVKSKNAPKTE